jgi:hypothetical protein
VTRPRLVQGGGLAKQGAGFEPLAAEASRASRPPKTFRPPGHGPPRQVESAWYPFSRRRFRRASDDQCPSTMVLGLRSATGWSYNANSGG